jgi:hypothetical protein
MTTKPVFASMPKWNTTCLRFRSTAEIPATNLPSWEGSNNIRIYCIPACCNSAHSGFSGTERHQQDETGLLHITTTPSATTISAFAPKLDRTHDHVRPGATSLATKMCKGHTCYDVHTRSAGAARTNHRCLL